MFIAILIMEERNIQYSQISSTVTELIANEVFNASIIDITNPPDFEIISQSQTQIYDFGFNQAKTLISNYLESFRII